MCASTTKDNFAATLFVILRPTWLKAPTWQTLPSSGKKICFFQQKHVRIRIGVKVQMVLSREARELSVFRVSGRYTKCVQQSLQKSIRTLAYRIAFIAEFRETISCGCVESRRPPVMTQNQRTAYFGWHIEKPGRSFRKLTQQKDVSYSSTHVNAEESRHGVSVGLERKK